MYRWVNNSASILSVSFRQISNTFLSHCAVLRINNSDADLLCLRASCNVVNSTGRFFLLVVVTYAPGQMASDGLLLMGLKIV
jgi:hypothetical protein